MTQKSKLKQRIRERSKRTGESYNAARLQVLAEIERTREKQTQDVAEKARKGTAKGAVSEERCIEKTGHGFDHWFGVLDRFGAPKKGHKASARHLQDDHEVSAWYAQSLMVMYGRARGLRELHQKCDGSYQFSVSRVLPVGLGEATALVKAVEEGATWSDGLDEGLVLALREALVAERLKCGETANHIRVRTDEQRFELRITAKEDGRSSVQVTVSHLSGPDALKRHRAAWRACLDSFRGVLKA